MVSSIPTFVHPASEAFSALSTSAALTYDNKESFVSVAATDTSVGSDGSIDYTTLAEDNDARTFHVKKVDSIITLGKTANVTMIASYQSGGLKFEEEYVTDAHQYGFSKCHTFGRCDASQMVGASCQRGGSKGFCYTSSAGTLECGRTVAMMRRFSSAEIDTFTPKTHLTLWAYGFVKYYGYTGTMMVSGSVGPMVTLGTTQNFGFDLSGVDPLCAGAPGAAANSCGIHIHAGKTCTDNALGHYYTGPVTSDPWTSITYTAGQDPSGHWKTTGLLNVDTGADSTQVAGRSVIVHAYDGSRIACALLTPSSTSKPPVRCPRGTPAEKGAPTNALITAKRLLIAGCMIVADDEYNPSAEVHVPQMCRVPADYQKGCGFPGALNFAPGSSQVGFCQYVTSGCTNANAVNYNSKATKDDGSCIVRKAGCTIHSDGYVTSTSADGFKYAPNLAGYPYTNDVVENKARVATLPTMLPYDEGKPLGAFPNHLDAKFDSLYVGVPLRVGGVIDYPAYPSVTNYDPNANVLQGCVVAVEGCMDSGAKNYNPAATINTNTWCVPVIEGCMIPYGPVPTPSGDRPLVANWDPAATVTKPKTCIHHHVGCMEPNMVNYDFRASVPSTCWPVANGCLDPTAINFGCTGRATSACGTLTNNVMSSSNVVTVHEEVTCCYEGDAYCIIDTSWLAAPENAETPMAVTVSLMLTGELEDYTPMVKTDMVVNYCATAITPAVLPKAECEAKTTVTITLANSLRRRLTGGGNVKATFTTETDNPIVGQAVQSQVKTTLGDSASGTTGTAVGTMFSGIAGVGTITQVDTNLPLTPLSRIAPPPPSSDNIGAIVGGAVGGSVGGLMLIGFGVYMYKKRQASGSYAKTVVPA